jgi:hypothetical protein
MSKENTTISESKSLTTSCKNDDIWHNTGNESDFFGNNIVKNGHVSDKCTSIMEAFDAIADFYEKPLPKKVEPSPEKKVEPSPEKKVVSEVKTDTKTKMKAKHLYRQHPLPKQQTYDDDYDDYYDNEYYDEESYYIKNKPIAKFK